MKQEEIDSVREVAAFVDRNGPDNVLVCRHHGIMMGQYALSMLPEMLAMIDEQANQNQKLEALAIKWWAWSMFIEEELDAIPQDKNYGDYYQEYERKAALELTLESPTWKKIGPDEEDAIGFAIAELEDADYDTVRQVDVLRKLLEGNA
jgi:hypothetical protein